MMSLKMPVFVVTILFLTTSPAVSGAMTSLSFLQDSRSLLLFPSFEKPFIISQISNPSVGKFQVETIKPASLQVSQFNMGLTRLPMGITLDRLHRNIEMGLQKSTSEPDACWIPIDPVGPIRIPMSVAYIDGYYYDTPWIPHVNIPG